MLRLHRLADSEFRAAVRWYRRESDQVALRFQHAVLDLMSRIEVQPDFFGMLESISESTQVRRARVSGFPYVVIFELTGLEIMVFAVAHTSRRPGYWRRRQRMD